jgi:hypothetical protein
MGESGEETVEHQELSPPLEIVAARGRRAQANLNGLLERGGETRSAWSG